MKQEMTRAVNGFMAQQREAVMAGSEGFDPMDGFRNPAEVRAELRRAFAQLEESGYGRCEDCETLIPPGRVRANRWSRCCERCQEVRDREVNEADIFPEAA